jgi:hypothetical protein
MIGVLIVTHGEIGTALLESSRQILGVELPQVATLSVWRQDDPDDLILRAGELIEGIDAGDGVLVLTDIFGATPVTWSRACCRTATSRACRAFRCRCCCACSPAATARFPPPCNGRSRAGRTAWCT